MSKHISAPRRVILIAVVAALAAGLPFIAEILGFQLAGTVWNALHVSSPWLSQAGELCGGILCGIVIGLALKVIARVRFLPWPVAGLTVALSYVIYHPAALLTAPIAASIAGSFDRRPQRWMTGLSLAGALAGMANSVPFPRPAALALCLCAGLSCGWADTASSSPPHGEKV
jgi:hypothetical protein